MDKKHLNSAEMIQRHSAARVVLPSRKVFVKRWGTAPDGSKTPAEFSRPLTDADVRASLARKFH